MSNASRTPIAGWAQLTCKVCESVFYLQPSRVKYGKGIYCSNSCWRRDMSARRKGSKGISRYGSENPNYKDGRAIYGRKAKHPDARCAECGTTERLHVHHLDHSHVDNSDGNLEVLCVTCHNRHHKPWLNSPTAQKGTTANRPH